MSSNVEDSDGSEQAKRYITRRSLRKISSNESLNSIGEGAVTPTLQLRNFKKLESISENASSKTAPQKNVSLSVDSPRRTRGISAEPTIIASPLRRTTRGMSQEKDITASPLRRTTRAMSQEKDITASPMPLRSTRRSVLADSDTEDMSTVTLTPGRVKINRKKRQSAIPSPTIENIEEETEESEMNEKEEDNKKSTKGDETVLNLSNDLELRTRSISKSPQVASPKKSLNESSVDAEKKEEAKHKGEDDVQEINFLEFSQVEVKVKTPKFFKNRTNKEKSTENEETDSRIESEAEDIDVLPQIEPFTNVHHLENNKKTTFGGVVERLVKSNKEPKSISPEEKCVGFADLLEYIDRREDSSASSGSTPHRRRSIHEMQKPLEEPKLSGKVKEMMNDFVSDDRDVETPICEKKTVFKKTPFSRASKSLNREEANEVTQNTSDMDISLMDSSIAQTDTENISIEKLSVSVTSSKGNEPESTGKKKSFASYLELVTTSSRSERKSYGALSDIKEKISPKKSKLSLPWSWNQSVAKSAEKSVDKLSKNQPDIIETADQRVKGYSSDEDEDDEVEKNSFIDDEAEVGSNDSITESELKYLEENEIPDDGESLGSQDTESKETKSDDEKDEDDDGDDDSFIMDGEEISDGYSMDSNEEKIEESPKKSPFKQNRKSRLIFQSESEDEKSEKIQPRRKSKGLESYSDEETAQSKVAENPGSKNTTPRKSIVPSLDQKVEEEPMQKSNSSRKSASFVAAQNDEEEMVIEQEPLNKSKIEEAPISSKKLRKSLEAKDAEDKLEKPGKLKKKRKRDVEDPNCSLVIKTKRVKLNEDGENETETMEMENISGIAGLFEESSESEIEVQEKPKKKPTKSAGTTDVESVLTKCNELMSIHNEAKKKALALKREKKAMKQLKKQQEAAKTGGESLDSSGSNKENGIKKKKKNKNKEKKQKLVADVPEQAKEDISTSVTKLQEKLERKRQRKLEKKLTKQQQQERGPNVDALPVESAQFFSTVSEVRVKKSKKPKVDEQLEIETPEIPKSKETKKQKKTNDQTEEIVHGKKLKKVKEVVQVEPVAEAVPKKKNNKKRKIEDPLVEDEAPKAKKLNILKQIEDPMQCQPSSRTVSAPKEKVFSAQLGSSKLKKVIPASVEIAKKQVKKPKKQQRVIPEPQKSLPRPVWTSSGVFIEQPVSPPYNFTSTKYVPIRTSDNSSTKFGVVVFEDKQKKPKRAASENQPDDFRSRYLAQNIKGRDGSMKNLRGLMPSKYF